MIRPWEIMFPELAQIRFAALYSVLLLITVGITTGIRTAVNFQTLSVAAFVVALAASTGAAYDVDIASDGLYEYMSIVMSFFLIQSVARSVNDLVSLIICYVGFQGVYLTKALLEFYVYGAYSYSQGVVRLIGIENAYGGSNAVAASTMIVLPFCYFLWTSRQEISDNWSRLRQTVFAWGIIAHAVISVWCVVLTNSRTGFVALGVYAFIAAGSAKRNLLRNLTLAAIVLGLGWQFLGEDHKARFRTIWDPDAGPKSAEISATSRKEGLRIGLAIFNRHPLLGVGPRNFAAYRRTHFDGVYLNAHNLAGQILAEIGILGTAAFMAIIAGTFYRIRFVRKYAVGESAEERLLQGVALATFHSLIILALVSITGHTLYRPNWLWTAAFAMLAAENASSFRPAIGNAQTSVAGA